MKSVKCIRNLFSWVTTFFSASLFVRHHQIWSCRRVLFLWRQRWAQIYCCPDRYCDITMAFSPFINTLFLSHSLCFYFSFLILLFLILFFPLLFVCIHLSFPVSLFPFFFTFSFFHAFYYLHLSIFFPLFSLSLSLSLSLSYFISCM